MTANRYELASEPFRLTRSTAPRLLYEDGRLRMVYPEGHFTFRSLRASWLRVAFRVDGRRVVRSSRTGAVLVPPGAGVTVPAGAARDRYYNVNSEPLTP